METSQKLREEHNRQVQREIDTERSEINKLESDKNALSPKMQNLQWELEQVNTEVRRKSIEQESREKKILVLQDKFWRS